MLSLQSQSASKIGLGLGASKSNLSAGREGQRTKKEEEEEKKEEEGCLSEAEDRAGRASPSNQGSDGEEEPTKKVGSAVHCR